MTGSNRDSPALIAVVSEGDDLSDLPLITLEAVQQNVREESEPFRPKLRAMGIGHSFFDGKLWLASLRGESPDTVTTHVVPMLDVAEHEPNEIQLSPQSHRYWHGVIKRAARDALAYSLRVREGSGNQLMARGSTMLDLSEQERRPRGLLVTPGIDLHRLYRAAGNRLFVGCSLVFHVLNSEGERVTDHGLITGPLARAYAHKADVRWGHMERIGRKVFPLEVRLANRTLVLPSIGVSVGGLSGV